MMRFTGYCLLLTAYLLLAACAPPQTASSSVAANATAQPALIATAQADQYLRDAQATVTSQAVTVEAVRYAIEQTAVSNTATYEAQMAQATSTAIAQMAQATATAQYQATADALHFAITAEAATAQAQALAAQATRQAVEATATYAAQATAGAMEATRQAFQMEQVRSEARRRELVDAAVFAVTGMLLFLVVVLGGYLLYIAWPLIVQRLKLVRYGQHGNPLYMEERNGRTIITNPLAMLQAGMVIDEDGNLTMPEMTPNDTQTAVMAGLIQLLREQAQYAPGHAPVLPSEIARRVKLGGYEKEMTTRHDTPTVLPPTAQPPYGLPSPTPLPQLSAAPAPIPLPTMPDGHVMVAGPTGAGKSNAIRAILTGRPNVVVLDPHAAPGNWNTPNVVGAGRDFPAIQGFMTWMLQELDRRAKLMAQGQKQFDTLTVATDEMPAIAQELGRGPAIVWRQWVREGRKFGLFFVVSTQSTRVKTLGIEGEGDLLENFKYVLLLGETAVGEYPELSQGMPRPAVLKTLQGAQPVIIPHMPTGNDVPTVLPPAPPLPPTALPSSTGIHTEWGMVSTEQAAKIVEMTEQKKSGRYIEKEVFGYAGGNAWKMRTAVLRVAAASLDGSFRLHQ